MEIPTDATRSTGYMTEERRLIQQTARDFTMREVLPLANKLDPIKGDIPHSLLEQMAEMGYFGITIPQEYGGLGLGAFEYCIVAEELARGWMSVASLIARGNGLFGVDSMTEEQRRYYLPRVARGEWLGAYALSEPNAGSDIANIACRARREGENYVITGTKYW
ncbi:MAG: acyl-CoA dehydrogenase family protein, partial [Steroidobacteraceae bacterium]